MIEMFFRGGFARDCEWSRGGIAIFLDVPRFLPFRAWTRGSRSCIRTPCQCKGCDMHVKGKVMEEVGKTRRGSKEEGVGERDSAALFPCWGDSSAANSGLAISECSRLPAG